MAEECYSGWAGLGSPACQCYMTDEMWAELAEYGKAVFCDFRCRVENLPLCGYFGGLQPQECRVCHLQCGSGDDSCIPCSNFCGLTNILNLTPTPMPTLATPMPTELIIVIAPPTMAPASPSPEPSLPTLSPTPSPTSSPTGSTLSPTSSPNLTPTPWPSSPSPTLSPTELIIVIAPPTISPTQVPTTPTQSPTASPSSPPPPILPDEPRGRLSLKTVRGSVMSTGDIDSGNAVKGIQKALADIVSKSGGEVIPPSALSVVAREEDGGRRHLFGSSSDTLNFWDFRVPVGSSPAARSSSSSVVDGISSQKALLSLCEGSGVGGSAQECADVNFGLSKLGYVDTVLDNGTFYDLEQSSVSTLSLRVGLGSEPTMGPEPWTAVIMFAVLIFLSAALLSSCAYAAHYIWPPHLSGRVGPGAKASKELEDPEGKVFQDAKEVLEDAHDSEDDDDIEWGECMGVPDHASAEIAPFT